MEEAKKNNYEDESPQQSLEKILKAENEITKEISAAKEQAEGRIEESQEEIAPLKIKIIEQARRDREEMLAQGIAAAKEDAQKRIGQAKTESDSFEKIGNNFVEEAVQLLETIILGEFESEEE
jgi:vacuolar-type H+-ATPase subunit H